MDGPVTQRNGGLECSLMGRLLLCCLTGKRYRVFVYLRGVSSIYQALIWLCFFFFFLSFCVSLLVRRGIKAMNHRLLARSDICLRTSGVRLSFR